MLLLLVPGVGMGASPVAAVPEPEPEAAKDVFAQPEPRGGRREKRWQREREQRLKLETELRELYLGVTQDSTTPPIVVQSAVEAVKPALRKGASPELPRPSDIDWEALADDARQARLALNTLRLLATREIAARAQRVADEEAAIAMLLLFP